MAEFGHCGKPRNRHSAWSRLFSGATNMTGRKLAVFSDTHLRDLDRGIPYLKAIIARHIPEAAMVLHAGDIGDPDLLLAFEGYQIHCVLGNTDVAVEGIGRQQIIECCSHRIGLIHGWGDRQEIERQVRDSFSNQRLDVIVFGHTHWPVCHQQAGMLMFNPGSCVDPRAARHHTFGILHLGRKVRGEIVNVDRLAAEFLKT